MNFIEKSTEEIEKGNGFDWYVEFKPKEMCGFDLEEHRKLMEVFIVFLPKENIRILKLNDGVVESSFESSYNGVLENIKLLEKGEGKLYDPECEISYSILTMDFFAIIQEGMVFWSSKKELAYNWAEKLREKGFNFFEPSFIEEEDGERDLWENRTKVNGVWIDDETGEVV